LRSRSYGARLIHQHQECVYDFGVEVSPTVLKEMLPCDVGFPRGSVWLIRCERVPYIDDGEDARREGDLLPREPVRIATSVPTLMVVDWDVEGAAKHFDGLQQ
jgi:hypothetical protein